MYINEAAKILIAIAFKVNNVKSYTCLLHCVALVNKLTPSLFRPDLRLCTILFWLSFWRHTLSAFTSFAIALTDTPHAHTYSEFRELNAYIF